MPGETERKCRFCENELLAVLKCIDDCVMSAEYTCEDSGEEYVILRFLNGYKTAVCVSCDSLSAMVGDVLNAIK